MNRVLSVLALAAGTVLFSAGATTQFGNADEAVKFRQSKLKQMGEQSERLGNMVRGRAPFDAKVALESAELMEALSKQPWPAFAPGYEGGKARPEVWKEQAKFKAASERLQGETAKLAAAAKTGDLDRIKAAFGDTANACRACHMDFRNR